jgi:peptidoglycan/LPS O-acetylase OafA/YrhL
VTAADLTSAAADGAAPAAGAAVAAGAAPADRAPLPAGARVRVPAIDGFRGYAAIAVVLFHVMYSTARPPLDRGILRSVLVSGYMGVDFFFVISGFVLFLPVVTSGGRFGDVRSYGVRRAARILPAYYLLLLGVVVLHPLITAVRADLPWTSWRGAVSLVLHMTFLEHTVGLVMNLPEGFAVHGAIWTLSLEAMFYVLLPLVAAWYFRRPVLGLVLALAGAALWTTLVTQQAVRIPGTGGPHSYTRVILVTQLPTYLGHFAAGMTAAWLFVRLRDGGQRLVTQAAVPVQALALVVVLLGMRAAGMRDIARGGSPYGDKVVGWRYDHWTGTAYIGVAFAVLLLATALAPRWAQWPVTNRFARAAGDASYGTYLWHLVIIGFAVETLGLVADGTNGPFFKMLPIALVGSLVAGWLSFRLVERPVVRWARRRTRGKRADADAEA